ncbi:MAG TPA: substrate-binding domain-containing protein [Tepidisphaeraceae bacterium]
MGIVVDGTGSFGRGVLRGVAAYANLQRQWNLHMEIWPIEHRLDQLPDCDGVIFAGQRPAVLDAIRKRVKHIVTCSGNGDPSLSPVVSLDDFAAGAMAAAHLIECRLERFAFCGPAYKGTGENRFIGFRRALEERGFTCIQSPPELAADTGWQLEGNQDRIAAWAASLPTPIGVMTFDDAAAHALARACLAANIGVPDRIAIIGVNNDDLLCECSWPPMTSIDCAWTRLGQKAAMVMEKLLAGQALSAEEWCTRLPPIGVVRRQSTDVLAVDDPNLADAIRYIREHACDPCTVEDVLEHVPVGRRWLERQFQKTLGRTPHDEMMRVRIETAQRLLTHATLALPDIAAKCGFSKSTHFHAAFRRLSGTTPAVYRRNAFDRASGVRQTPRVL